MIFLKKSRDLARGRPLGRPLEYRLNFGPERPSSAHRADIEPRSSALSAHRALGALLAPFGRPTQLTLRPRAAGAGFRFTDAPSI